MKTIIEMATEVYGECVWHKSALHHLEAFADLVRADERGNQRHPLTLNEMSAIEEYVYMQTTHKGKPSFEYAQALIRATEAAHNIGAKP
jgi:hypothetical protein